MSDYDYLKRILDVVLATIIMLGFLPVFLVLTVLVKLTSRGPVFFVQERAGLKGKRFRMFKFRSMYADADHRVHRQYVEKLIQKGEKGGKTYKLENDPRITPLGRWMRKFSLDELPQFINVLRGDMSLVGPRPPIPYELEIYKPWHFKRLDTKPGITGLWQVSGRNLLTFDQQAALDIKYIHHKSLAMDLTIIIKTIPVMFSGVGAV